MVTAVDNIVDDLLLSLTGIVIIGDKYNLFVSLN